MFFCPCFNRVKIDLQLEHYNWAPWLKKMVFLFLRKHFYCSVELTKASYKRLFFNRVLFGYLFHRSEIPWQCERFYLFFQSEKDVGKAKGPGVYLINSKHCHLYAKHWRLNSKCHHFLFTISKKQLLSFHCLNWHLNCKT